jgi:hypothetical protein
LRHDLRSGLRVVARQETVYFFSHGVFLY